MQQTLNDDGHSQRFHAVLGEEISVASWIASLIETRYGGIEHHFKSGCPDDDCMLFCLPGLDLDEFADIAEVNIAMVAGWFRSIQPRTPPALVPI